MGYKKPKEKKSRLKDLEDLIDPDILEKLLPKKEPKKEIPEGLKDLLKKRFKDRDFWDKLKPVPLPEYEPDPDRIKPVPMPKYIPPYELDPSLPKPVPLPEIDPWWHDRPIPKRFDPERGPDPKYWAEAGDEGKHIYKVLGQDVTKEQYDQVGEWQKLSLNGQDLYRMYMEKKGLDPNTLLPPEDHRKVMDALINQGYLRDKDEPFKNFGWDEKAGGGIMDINAMTAPLGYEHGGDVSLDKIMADMEGSEGPGEQGTISKAIYKLAGDPGIDPIWAAKEKIKDFGRTGIETLKGLGSGAMKLLGAGPLEASELPPEIELELLDIELKALQGLPGSTISPSNQDQIKKLEKRIRELYTQLGP